MGDGALRDSRTEIHDSVERGQRRRIVQPAEGLLGDAIQIVVVAPKQLDEDRFLGLEMVIEAAGQDSRGVGDLLQRVRSPDVAINNAAVCRISVRRVPSS